SAYSAAAGFGWSGGSVTSFDSGSGDALGRDGNSTADSTFLVDLPSGVYDVTVTAGDTKARGAKVSLQGLFIETLSTVAGEIATRTYRDIIVTGGQLSLRIQADTSVASAAVLDGLKIDPVVLFPVKRFD